MIQFAHVKWFVDENSVPNNVSLGISEWLVVAAITIAGIFILRLINQILTDRGIEKTINKKTASYRQWVPLIVRLSTAAFLLINIQLGYLLAPNVLHSDSAITTIIVVMQAIVALLLIIGVYTRTAVVLLLSSCLLTLSETSLVNVLDHLEYLGIGGYLWFRGPGSYSLSAKHAKNGKLNTPEGREKSLPIYRIGVGAAFVILALSEKLMNMSVAQEFLAHHNWNLLSGFGVSDYWFIILAGTVEFVVGLAIVLNLAPRLLTLVVLGLMTTTAILLGVEEIYGHLFAVGFVFAIWVNDINPAKTDVKPGWL